MCESYMCYMCESYLCESMPHVYGCPRKSEEDTRSPGSGLIGGCEGGSGPLEEREVLLTDEPFFQLPNIILLLEFDLPLLA